MRSSVHQMDWDETQHLKSTSSSAKDDSHCGIDVCISSSMSGRTPHSPVHQPSVHVTEGAWLPSLYTIFFVKIHSLQRSGSRSCIPCSHSSILGDPTVSSQVSLVPSLSLSFRSLLVAIFPSDGPNILILHVWSYLKSPVKVWDLAWCDQYILHGLCEACNDSLSHNLMLSLCRALIPLHEDFRLAGMLPPLDPPHHMRASEWCSYR